MREIKFRAWDGTTMRHDVLAGHGEYVADHEDEIIWWWHDPPKAIMQYTGLNDRNGKELYFGDVARLDDHESWVAVQDDFGIPCWLPADGRAAVLQFSDYFMRGNVRKDDFEIIGNVHENPDLLDG